MTFQRTADQRDYASWRPSGRLYCASSVVPLRARQGIWRMHVPHGQVTRKPCPVLSNFVICRVCSYSLWHEFVNVHQFTWVTQVLLRPEIQLIQPEQLLASGENSLKACICLVQTLCSTVHIVRSSLSLHPCFAEGSGDQTSPLPACCHISFIEEAVLSFPSRGIHCEELETRRPKNHGGNKTKARMSVWILLSQ